MLANEQILNDRTAKFNERQGARVGDFLKLRNGNYVRFSHNWGEDIQTACEWSGSFYLASSSCSFSGSLYGAIKHKLMRQIDETKKGAVWFFNNDEARAHNGFNTEMDFRVFEIIDPEIEPEILKKTGLQYQFDKQGK